MMMVRTRTPIPERLMPQEILPKVLADLYSPPSAYDEDKTDKITAMRPVGSERSTYNHYHNHNHKFIDNEMLPKA